MIGSVLLIDDDTDVLRAIGNYFEQLGWEVTRELSGEAGLATYDRLHPDVVMLDLHLPGMDGLEVLEKLRERIAGLFADRFEDVQLLVPYDEGAALSALYALGAPISMRHDTDDTGRGRCPIGDPDLCDRSGLAERQARRGA